MDVTPIGPDTATEEELGSLRGCLESVRRADLPADPPPGWAEVAARLYPSADREPRTWLARDTGGPVTGTVTLWVFTGPNAHLSKVDIQVRPDRRRRGLGRRLLALATAEARDLGRRQAYSWVIDGTPAEALASRVGARPVLASARRVLRTAGTAWSTLDGHASGAASRIAGYELLRWVGGCPDGALHAYSRLLAGMNDAPTGGSGLRPEEWSGADIRRDEAYLAALRLRVYTLLARDRSSGVLAGMTSVHVRPDSVRAAQAATTVLASHRGNGIGLWLKANMLRWLAGAEPHVTEYETHNADDNTHMVAVNDRLGYRVENTMRMWRVDL